jgi:hypothetical protein
LRSVRPGRYGHGAGLVTKKRGNLTGAVTARAILSWSLSDVPPVRGLCDYATGFVW